MKSNYRAEARCGPWGLLARIEKVMFASGCRPRVALPTLLKLHDPLGWIVEVPKNTVLDAWHAGAAVAA